MEGEERETFICCSTYLCIHWLHLFYIEFYIYIYYFFKFSPKDMFIDFDFSEKEGERDSGKHQCEREAWISCLLYTP